jgi:hypothetical protein
MIKANEVIRMGGSRGGINHGSRRLASVRLQFSCELDDQDRVLARQRRQHDKGDLREDVVVAFADPDIAHRGKETERHD